MIKQIKEWIEAQRAKHRLRKYRYHYAATMCARCTQPFCIHKSPVVIAGPCLDTMTPEDYDAMKIKISRYISQRRESLDAAEQEDVSCKKTASMKN